MTILVAGAGGALGFEIVRRLRAVNTQVIATYRTPREGLDEKLKSLGAEPVQADLLNDNAMIPLLGRSDRAIFIPILSVSQEIASLLRHDQRAVFFSSNNVAIDPQAEVYAALLDAEARVREAAPGAVILRPTMIYGYPGDGNLSRLIGAMRQLPFVPFPGSGAALQQPVYFTDLAGKAVEIILGEQKAFHTAAVAGPIPVTQRALYKIAMAAAGASPVIVPAPTSLAAPILYAAEWLGLKLPVTAAQLRRASLDKLPLSETVILGDTSLKTGLEALVGALDGAAGGA